MNDFKSFYGKGKKDGGNDNNGTGGGNGNNGTGGGNGAFGGTGVNGGNGNGGNYGNCSVGGDNGNGSNAANGNGSNGNADYRQTADMMAMLAKAFGGKSEAQMWRAVLAQAEEGKRNGTLTNQEIDNFYATVAPMLDGFKRRKLKEIIEKLKAI